LGDRKDIQPAPTIPINSISKELKQLLNKNGQLNRNELRKISRDTRKSRQNGLKKHGTLL